MEAVKIDPAVKFKNERLALAKSLVNSLERGDEANAERAIHELTCSHGTYIFQEVGKLARELHDALEFCRDEKRLAEITKNEIPDARERLHYILSKTEESAHKTLDIIEFLLPISVKLSDESNTMQEDWRRFKRREMTVEEFRKFSNRLESFLETACNHAEKIKTDLYLVMVAQDYQDLTGQIIRKVINLVQDVENKLVSVIRHVTAETCRDSDKPRCIEPEGPQINQSKNLRSVSGQDDVDDLLVSLGF